MSIFAQTRPHAARSRAIAALTGSSIAARSRTLRAATMVLTGIDAHLKQTNKHQYYFMLIYFFVNSFSAALTVTNV